MLRLVNTDLEMQQRLELLSSRTWHKEKYKYVHSDTYQPLYFPDPKSNCSSTLCYAVVKNDNPDDIVGYVQVTVQANNFWISCAINFTDDIWTMGEALHDLIAVAIHDQYHKIAVSVMLDNPAEPHYASLAYELGGHLEGHLRDHIRTWDNVYRDMEDFGVLRREIRPKMLRRYNRRYDRRADKMFY